MQWEYRTIRFDRRRFFSSRIDSEYLDSKLNTRGAAGWELVGLTSSCSLFGITTEVLAVLKRPKGQ